MLTQLPYKDLMGSSQLQVALSTGGQAQIAPNNAGIYDVWSPVNDAYVSVQTQPISTAAITSSNGYLIKGGAAPVPVMIPAQGVIVAGSTISSGVLCAEKVANY